MEKFSIYSYLSLINTKGSWWVAGSEEMYQLINFLINTGLVLNRWIYQVVDLSLQIFMSSSFFEGTIGSIFKIAASVYQSLFSTLGVTIFVLALGIIFLTYTFKSPQESFRKLLTLFLVIGVNFAVFSNGEEYLKDLTSIFDEVEQIMIKAVELPFPEEDGTQTEIEAGTEESVQRIREAYFKMTIYQTFAMVNFGTSIYEERFDDFLYTDNQTNDQSTKDNLKERIETESETNRYMTPDGALDKWFISVYAWVSNLFTGVPLMLMSGLNFLLKIVILGLVLLLPLISIISLLPSFSSAVFNLLGKIILIFFIGTFMSLGLYLFFFLMMLMDHSMIAMAGGSSLISSVLGSFSKAVVVIIVVRYRNQVIRFITGRRITYIEEKDRTFLKSLKINQQEVQAFAEISTSQYDSAVETAPTVPTAAHFREFTDMNVYFQEGESVEKLTDENQFERSENSKLFSKVTGSQKQLNEFRTAEETISISETTEWTEDVLVTDNEITRSEMTKYNAETNGIDFSQDHQLTVGKAEGGTERGEETAKLRSDKPQSPFKKSSDEEKQLFYRELEELRLQ